MNENMKEVVELGMTNEQSSNYEILARIDEVDQMIELAIAANADPLLIEQMRARKKELREMKHH